MPCANARARAKEPVPEYVRRRNPEPLLNHLHPTEGVMLSVDYHPGFTPDLTGWTIQIRRDGEVRQAVRWYRSSSREEELLDPVTLGQREITKLEEFITRWNADAFEELNRAACVDDAANVSLVLKARGLQADLPYFHFVHLMKKGLIKLNESQKVALSAFGDLWKFTDRLAPYSLHEHEKRSNKARHPTPDPRRVEIF